MSLVYQHGDPLHQFHLAVGDGHQIAVEEFGVSNGVPVLVLHGGPGTGLCRNSLRFFNPNKYRVILFSQRGCKDSTPHQFDHITTDSLLRDIQTLKNHFDIDKTLLAGGSWGATLALLFAQQYPEQINGLILWSTFLASREDLHWLYGANGAAAQFYPEQYQQFSMGVDGTDELLERYRKGLFSEDELRRNKLATLWCDWDHLITTNGNEHGLRLNCMDSQLQKAKYMSYFFSHQCFINQRQIIENVAELKGFPIWFIHSRHDLMCRYAAVYELATRCNAQLSILNGVGHDSNAECYSEAVRRAADLMLCKLSKR
ncbi:alpha/beta fold hydrolase [Pseudoalteromonas sp. T1lg65]|uniref:alpha/beta fold hydrolase n=1 Tax=Pseudoalteromonas sp. T1lg65 TaxID=2077101 RepID=UPI003F78C153